MDKAPSKLGLRFFRWYCRDDRREELEGDLLEMFQYRHQKGITNTLNQLLFIWDVIRCFKPYAVKTTRNKMNTALYKSYLRIGFRSAMKNKGPVLFNIIGLGLAIGFCITIYMMVAYNLEFDSFYPEEKTNDLYRVHTFRSDNTETYRYELSPIALASNMESTVSFVDELFFFDTESTIIKIENDFFTEQAGFASENFLDQMEIPLLAGNKSAFKNPNTIFLTEQVSKKYFGNISPVGKIVTVYLRKNIRKEMKIGGVFKRIPLNTSFYFNVLINADALLKETNVRINDWSENYKAGIYFTSLNPKQVEKEINKFIPLQNKSNRNWQADRFDIIPFIDARVADHIVDYSPTNMRVRPQVLIIFGFMGLLILLVATLNITNTSIALISKRLKEVGIRKTLGTARRQIFIQFLVEMIIITSASLIIALFVCNVFANEFFSAFGVEFMLNDISITNFIPFIVIFLLFITFLAGVIPAIYAGKFQPVEILNKKYKIKKVGFFNKVLTISQYAFSIAVLIAGMAFMQNTSYLKDYDFGFDADNLIVLSVPGSQELKSLETELKALPFIEKTAKTSDHVDFTGGNSLYKIDTGSIEVRKYEVGPEYLEIMKIELLSGRFFRENSSFDLQSSVVVNKEFANRYLDSENNTQTIIIDNHKRNVIGITENISSDVYADAITKPQIFLPAADSSYSYLLAKTTSGKTRKEIESSIKSIWVDLFESPYSGNWQTDRSGFYAVRDSNNLKMIFLFLAGLGCLMSLIGIFSLATINTLRKKKEISIRKILGAGFRDILMSTNRNFGKILLFGLLLGVGFGYLISEQILQMIYKYYLPVSITYSVIIGCSVISIAFLLIIAASIKPLNTNPGEGLRTE